MSQFNVKCNCCGGTFQTKGTADYQSVGDGGPAECTGVELEEPYCPTCGSDSVEVLDEEYPNFEE